MNTHRRLAEEMKRKRAVLEFAQALFEKQIRGDELDANFVLETESILQIKYEISNYDLYEGLIGYLTNTLVDEKKNFLNSLSAKGFLDETKDELRQVIKTRLVIEKLFSA